MEIVRLIQGQGKSDHHQSTLMEIVRLIQGRGKSDHHQSTLMEIVGLIQGRGKSDPISQLSWRLLDSFGDITKFNIVWSHSISGYCVEINMLWLMCCCCFVMLTLLLWLLLLVTQCA